MEKAQEIIANSSSSYTKRFEAHFSKKKIENRSIGPCHFIPTY